MKNVHRGKWVVKNDQNYVHVVIEWPLKSNLEKFQLLVKQKMLKYDVYEIL